MIKGVIFDMDGTLIDSMGFWDGVAAAVVRKYGKIPEADLGHKLIPLNMREGADYIKETYNLDITPEKIIEEINATIERFYSKEAEFKCGAKKLLDILKKDGIPWFVATATDRHHVEAVFKRLGVLNDIKMILTCSDLNTSKTQPYIYYKAAEILGLRPEETLVFEDSLHAAEAVKNAGFVLCGIYDTANEDVQERLKSISDYYSIDFEDFIRNYYSEKSH